MVSGFDHEGLSPMSSSMSGTSRPLPSDRGDTMLGVD